MIHPCIVEMVTKVMLSNPSTVGSLRRLCVGEKMKVFVKTVRQAKENREVEGGFEIADEPSQHEDGAPPQGG